MVACSQPSSKLAAKIRGSNEEVKGDVNSKLRRIKELIEEKIDTELAQLIGEADKPKRGRRKKEGEDADDPPSSQP
jgi:hypothetical protein